MKYSARIKLQVELNSAYQNGKIIELFKHNSYVCRYRYKESSNLRKHGTFEFVYGNFNNKEEAFIEGKKLYFNLLYLMNIERLPFNLQPIDFNVKKLRSNSSHLVRKSGADDSDQFYFCNHDVYNNYFGLEVYEINRDFFEEYDSDECFCKELITTDITLVQDHVYNFDMLKELTIEYDNDSYKIFEMLEKTNNEDNILIKLLLLSICYERLAEIVCNFYKQKGNPSDKELQFIEICEKEEVDKKCRELVKEYKGEYYSNKKAKKIFHDMYDIRCKFAHGTRFDEKNILETYLEAQKLFLISFKNFMKNKE